MIKLCKITDSNFDECVKLEPKDDQKNFVASNVSSLAEAYVGLSNNECIPMPYAIYNNDVMIGFVMLAYIQEDNEYWVCRFMIDKHHQQEGHGKKAMLEAIELLKHSEYGKASEILLSYEPENIAAKALYASLGFVETGEVEDDEIVAKLKL